MAKNNMSDKGSARKELLLHMYDQMFNDINRHIMVIWQPITVLVGSLALLAAGIREILPVDIAVALIVLLVGWLIATLYDSAYWYNRNLVIISNIERQFLLESDLKEIHYYFGRHRTNKMIDHLRIQRVFGIGLGSLVVLYHLWSEVFKMCPCLSTVTVAFRWEVLLPYIAVIVVIFWIRHQRNYCNKKYRNFIKNSPGKWIDTGDIEYGVGHPVDKDTKNNKLNKEK